MLDHIQGSPLQTIQANILHLLNAKQIHDECVNQYTRRFLGLSQRRHIASVAVNGLSKVPALKCVLKGRGTCKKSFSNSCLKWSIEW